MAITTQPENTYLVGGAVRDRLLGLPVIERDWVVVGSNPSVMKAAGYTQVGRDFPVFLHPASHEEYALARIERKVSSGHTGFVCDSSETVTLEQDLGRRDLTINAIAEDSNGVLIDPYQGCQDLNDRVLRHVSDAFSEDPLRILRVARFAARFNALGFTIAAETSALCMAMVQEGALQELSPERVYQEIDKSLSGGTPAVFFEVLEDFGAAAILWPEIKRSALASLRNVTPQLNNPQRFAVLFQEAPVDRVRHRCGNLRVPRPYQELAIMCAEHRSKWSCLETLSAAEIVAFLYFTDAIHRPDRFEAFCGVCCHIQANNEDGNQESRSSMCLTGKMWIDCLNTISGINSADIASGLKGRDIGNAIRQAQVDLIEAKYEN